MSNVSLTDSDMHKYVISMIMCEHFLGMTHTAKYLNFVKSISRIHLKIHKQSQLSLHTYLKEVYRNLHEKFQLSKLILHTQRLQSTITPHFSQSDGHSMMKWVLIRKPVHGTSHFFQSQPFSKTLDRHTVFKSVL